METISVERSIEGKIKKKKNERGESVEMDKKNGGAGTRR